MPWNAYIDESGDRGWTFKPQITPGRRAGSSRLFGMTAVLVPTGSEHIALATYDAASTVIGRKPPTTIHWVALNHSQRRILSSAVATIPSVKLISVVLCKQHLPNAATIVRPEALYNWTFRLMIERLSWFGHHVGDTVQPTFAQVGGITPAVLAAYVARLLANSTYIDWSRLALPIRIDTPARRRMLQVADTASGAVMAAFEPDPWGMTEQAYIRAMQPIVWRRPGRQAWKDGLKYGPNPPTCDPEHPWFAAWCNGVP
jgi:hypothetical protein